MVRNPACCVFSFMRLFAAFGRHGKHAGSESNEVWRLPPAPRCGSVVFERPMFHAAWWRDAKLRLGSARIWADSWYRELEPWFVCVLCRGPDRNHRWPSVSETAGGRRGYRKKGCKTLPVLMSRPKLSPSREGLVKQFRGNPRTLAGDLACLAAYRSPRSGAQSKYELASRRLRAVSVRSSFAVTAPSTRNAVTMRRRTGFSPRLGACVVPECRRHRVQPRARIPVPVPLLLPNL
jgi:hypothetical protein